MSGIEKAREQLQNNIKNEYIEKVVDSLIEEYDAKKSNDIKIGIVRGLGEIKFNQKVFIFLFEQLKTEKSVQLQAEIATALGSTAN